MSNSAGRGHIAFSRVHRPSFRPVLVPWVQHCARLRTSYRPHQFDWLFGACARRVRRVRSVMPRHPTPPDATRPLILLARINCPPPLPSSSSFFPSSKLSTLSTSLQFSCFVDFNESGHVHVARTTLPFVPYAL